jgi:TolB protein
VNLPGSCWDRATDSIAYTADPEGADQVYLVAADASTRPRRVTTDPEVAFEPSLSPDGTQVVFENHQAGERGVIAIADVATGTVRQITSGADDRQPNWSPRGDLIVFQRTRARAPDLYVVRPDGGGLRNVTKTKRLEETDVSFSPSGNWLVFSSDGDEIDVASLFTISINGRGRRQLTRTRGIYDGAPSWSPSGTTIAFESARGDPVAPRALRSGRSRRPRTAADSPTLEEITMTSSTTSPASTRIPIRIRPWWIPLLVATGMRPSRSYVEIGPDTVCVRMGAAFKAEIPRASIRNPRRTRNRISIGVHGGRGLWLVNGASGPLVRFDIDPPTRAKLYGIAVKLRELMVSVDDPEALIAQLS